MFHNSSRSGRLKASKASAQDPVTLVPEMFWLSSQAEEKVKNTEQEELETRTAEIFDLGLGKASQRRTGLMPCLLLFRCSLTSLPSSEHTHTRSIRNYS